MPTLKGTGTNDKKKVAVAAALGFVVLALAYHTLFGGPSETVPAPVPNTASSAPAAVPARPVAGARPAAAAFDASLDPALHPELMAENENYLYAGTGAIFFRRTQARQQRQRQSSSPG